MEVRVERLPKATVKLYVKVPSQNVKETYSHVLKEYSQNTLVEGFRKGKAPLELVEKNVKTSDLNSETINHLLKHYYVSALKENSLNPLGNPKVLIKEFDKEKDFEFEVTIAVKPEIKLGDYKKKIKELYNGKGEGTKEKLKVEEIINAISEVSELEVSDILIEEELTRMLSRLLQQAESLGLGIDQYLTAQNKTAEQLRKEYEALAQKNLKTEFALSKAAEEEEIKVEAKEIEDAINAVPDEKLKVQLLQNKADRWYITSVLAKNKLITKLINETEDAKNA
ncbi:hypothetical protein HY419_02005 [candidate division WWE3 bacterium]|nr:hypothetical protein [candidate division WWE3 bacterium]